MARSVVVAGGSGFLGSVLCRALADAGWSPTVLARHLGTNPPWPQIAWDARTVGVWKSALERADAVVNLSGETISQKWTFQAQTDIRRSRVESTRAIGEAIAACRQPPRVWLNASAVGFYGDRGDEVLDESSPPGDPADFLVHTCLDWEAAVDAAQTPATAKAVLRVGMVLGREGGAFPTLLKLARAFLGGASGSGRQWVSWIHAADLARLATWVLERAPSGPVNATAPEPVTNETLMASIRTRVGRPWSPRVPTFGLQLASLFGAPDPTLLLNSQRALPKAALDGGFEFEHPTLHSALDALVP